MMRDVCFSPIMIMTMRGVIRAPPSFDRAYIVGLCVHVKSCSVAVAASWEAACAVGKDAPVSCRRHWQGRMRLFNSRHNFIFISSEIVMIFVGLGFSSGWLVV